MVAGSQCLVRRCSRSVQVTLSRHQLRTYWYLYLVLVDTVHLLLDLHGFLLQSASRPTTTTTELSLTPSFGTPISPSDAPLGASQPSRAANSALGMHPQMIPALPLPSQYSWTQERLMQLKIWLREQFPRDADPSGVVKQVNIETLTSGFGRNDETVRFSFW